MQEQVEVSDILSNDYSILFSTEKWQLQNESENLTMMEADNPYYFEEEKLTPPIDIQRISNWIDTEVATKVLDETQNLNEIKDTKICKNEDLDEVVIVESRRPIIEK